MVECAHAVEQALLACVPIAKVHHAAAVGIVGARHANFVAIVDHRHTRNGEVEGVKKRQFVVGHRVADADFARPSAGFGVFAHFQIARRHGHETRFVVVAADVAHQVVRAVDFQTAAQNVVQPRECAAAVAVECRCGLVEHVEIELTIEHARVHITCHQFGAAIRFTNLVEVAFRVDLLHFVGYGAPKFFVHMLACVVAETIDAEFFHPIDGRIGHHSHHLRVAKIEARHKHIEPSGEALFVP